MRQLGVIGRFFCSTCPDHWVRVNNQIFVLPMTPSDKIIHVEVANAKIELIELFLVQVIKDVEQG